MEELGIISAIWKAILSVETGGMAALATASITLAVKIVQKKLDRHSAVSREEQRAINRFKSDLDTYIGDMLSLLHSETYGKFSRTLRGYLSVKQSEAGKKVDKIRILRKSNEEINTIKEFRKSWDTETKDILKNWLHKAIEKNISVYNYDTYEFEEGELGVDDSGDMSLPKKLENKILQHSELLRGHIATMVSKEVGEHRVVEEVINKFLTFEEIYRIYRMIIIEFIEMKAELNKEIKELESHAIISPRKRKLKKAR